MDVHYKLCHMPNITNNHVSNILCSLLVYSQCCRSVIITELMQRKTTRQRVGHNTCMDIHTLNTVEDLHNI